MSSSTETAGRCPFGHGAEAPAGHHGYQPFQMKDPFPAYAELRAGLERLVEHFRPHNRSLEQLLGLEVGWDN